MNIQKCFKMAWKFKQKDVIKIKVAVIDADLIGRKKHRFPNLASMKISGYYKKLGSDVELKLDYEDLESYDKVFISKVFTDTPIDESVLNLPNVEYGGTGFFYDKAPKLPYEVEHHVPDYHLYDEWVQQRLDEDGNRNDFKYYLDYSIGLATRGCFRQCQFCVNKNYKKVEVNSPLDEFVDYSRKRYVYLMTISLVILVGKIFYLNYKQLENHFSLNKGLMRDY